MLMQSKLKELSANDLLMVSGGYDYSIKPPFYDNHNDMLIDGGKNPLNNGKDPFYPVKSIYNNGPIQ